MFLGADVCNYILNSRELRVRLKMRQERSGAEDLLFSAFAREDGAEFFTRLQDSRSDIHFSARAWSRGGIW